MLWARALCCSPACVRSCMQTTRSRSPIHLPARMTYGYPGTAYTCWVCKRADSSFYGLTTRPIAAKPAAWRSSQLLGSTSHRRRAWHHPFRERSVRNPCERAPVLARYRDVCCGLTSSARLSLRDRPASLFGYGLVPILFGSTRCHPSRAVSLLQDLFVYLPEAVPRDAAV